MSLGLILILQGIGSMDNRVICLRRITEQNVNRQVRARGWDNVHDFLTSMGLSWDEFIGSWWDWDGFDSARNEYIGVIPEPPPPESWRFGHVDIYAIIHDRAYHETLAIFARRGEYAWTTREEFDRHCS